MSILSSFVANRGAQFTRWVVLAVIFSSLTAGCSVWNSRSTQFVEASSIALSSCAPNDNRKLELYLPIPPAEAVYCEDFQHDKPDLNDHIKLDIYGTSSMHVDSTYDVGREVDVGYLYSSGGWGSWCTSPTDCIPLERGTVSFLERLDENRVRFHADLKFEDGRTLSTTRVAAYCERTVICG